MRKVIFLLLVFCTSILFGWKLDSWKHTVWADSATYADVVYGEVGWEGHCIDAYLDSVYGCSPVVFTVPVNFDSNAYFGDTVDLIDARVNEINFVPKKPQALITFIFDDGNDTDYDVMKPLFDAKGEVACISLVANLVENANYVTWAEVIEMENDGWEMLNHTTTHTRLTTIDLDSIRDELAVAQDSFELYNLTVRNFVYPFNSSADSVRRVVREYFRAAVGYVGIENVNLQMLETHRLNRVNIDNDADSLTFKTYIDYADSLERWLILYGHAMSSADSTHIVYLIDYIQSKSISIVTVDQALDLIGNLFEVGDNIAIGETGLRAHYIEGNTEIDGDILSKHLKLIRPQSNAKDTLLNLVWADTNANFIYKPAIHIDMDTTLASPANTQVVGINIKGTAFNDEDDKLIYTGISGNEWRADGRLKATIGQFTEGIMSNLEVSSVLKIRNLHPQADVDIAFAQLYDKDFKFYWSATKKGDFILRDGNYPGNANADFFQIQDSASNVVLQVSNTGDLTVEGVTTLNDSLLFGKTFLKSKFIDVTVPRHPLANPPGTNDEDKFATLDFDPDTDEMVYMQMDTPHGYKSAGTIDVHYGFFVDGAVTGAQDTIVWGCEYKKLVHGTDIFDFGAGTAIVLDSVEVTTTTDQKVLNQAIVTLVTTGWEEDDHMLLRFFRDADNGTDTFTADGRMCLIHVDYEMDQPGGY